MSEPIVDTPYVRVDRMPRIDAAGLLVSVRLEPDAPVGSGPQTALAHALDAAGWWIGVGDDGRAMVGMGTTAGPVSLAVGAPLRPGEPVEVIARIPGRIGDRLEIEVRGTDSSARRGAVIGAALVPSPGPLLWGCRSLRDRVLPEQTFRGTVGPVVLIGDAAASADPESEAPVRRLAWDLVARTDVDLLGAADPVVL